VELRQDTLQIYGDVKVKRNGVLVESSVYGYIYVKNIYTTIILKKSQIPKAMIMCTCYGKKQPVIFFM